MAKYQLNHTKFLFITEETALLKAIDGINEQHHLLIMLGLKTGARASELLGIRQQDLLSDNCIFIRGLKGSDDREVPVRPELFAQLKKYARLQDEHLFPINDRYVRRIWHKHRPVKKKFHALRHTYAVRLYEKTQDIKLVKDMLGHRNIANTMIYLDYVDKQSNKRRAVL